MIYNWQPCNWNELKCFTNRSKTLQIRRTSCLFETNQYKKKKIDQNTDRYIQYYEQRDIKLLEERIPPLRAGRSSRPRELSLKDGDRLLSKSRYGNSFPTNESAKISAAIERNGRSRRGRQLLEAFKGSRILRGVEEFREWPHAPRGRKIFTRSIGILWSSCRQTEARQ